MMQEKNIGYDNKHNIHTNDDFR